MCDEAVLPVRSNVESRHGPFDVRVFGCVVRGEVIENSDVDFLVSAANETSHFE